MIVYGLRSQVVTCDICGMYAHAQCAAHRLSSRVCPCRVASVHKGCKSAMPEHHWVKGNIDPMDTCEICGLFCGSLLALSGIHCSWCHRRVHDTCFQEKKHTDQLKYCDLGPHSQLLLPATSIIIRNSMQPTSSFRKAATSAVNSIAKLRLRSQGSNDRYTRV